MSNPLSVGSHILADGSSAAPGPERQIPWRERRDWFRARLQEQPLAGIGADEAEGHFSAMPPRYWERVNEDDLVWGLETVHGFLRTVATASSSATKPFVKWTQPPQSSWTRVMLCTWDRHGLLAKAAAAFSAVRLNILQAEVFTRSDNIVLDLFSVADAGGHTKVNPVRLEEMSFLLEGALSEPPRFASVWACNRHKFLAPPPRLPPRITFEHDSARDSILLRVEVADRLGLLYDILQAMADTGLDVTDARIETKNGMAHDVIHFTDSGQRTLDGQRIEDLRRTLAAALNVRD